MRRRLMVHLRGNAVGYVALFVALGGTGYSAEKLSSNSVGESQLKTGAVGLKKLGFPLGGAAKTLTDVVQIAPGAAPQTLGTLTVRHRQRGRAFLFLTASVVVSNPGDTPAAVALHFTVDGKQVGHVSTARLAPGATQTVANLGIPPCVMPARHTVTLVATANGGPISIGARALGAQVTPES